MLLRTSLFVLSVATMVGGVAAASTLTAPATPATDLQASL